MVAMSNSCAANTELASSIAALSKCSYNKVDVTKPPVEKCGFDRSFNRSSHLSLSNTEVGRRSRKSSNFISMSKSSGESPEGLTYKDSGVDIDAGTELVRRIAKMAPGIGGFGGLYPLGIISFIYIFF